MTGIAGSAYEASGHAKSIGQDSSIDFRSGVVSRYVPQPRNITYFIGLDVHKDAIAVTVAQADREAPRFLSQLG